MISAKKFLKFIASLRLAVFVILGLAVVSAVGTITEAKFNDAEVATKLVYQSPYMYAVLGLLIVNLIGVMIDRWPWKRHHAGFICAHIGIIVLLFGAWVTQRFGVDGHMVFEIGEKKQAVTVKDRDLLVYASLGSGFRPLFEGEVDFLRRPPTAEKPFVVSVGTGELKFVEHYQFAYRESQTVASDDKVDTPAIRFQLENPNVNMTQWLRLERGRAATEIDLGPAKIVLAKELRQPSGRNEVLLIQRPNSEWLDYVIYNKDNSLRKKGQVKQSETVETGWMGLKFRLLRYLPHSAEVVHYVKAEYNTPATTSAAKFIFNGKEHWIGLNAPLRLYEADKAYIVVYGHRQLDLAFPLTLKKFRVGKYEGTQRAATYESEVQVPGQADDVVISMNSPLKHSGFTFYQSSFEQNEKGEPVASVLSVNHDPGRWLKYLGSFLIVFGSILLFYFKRATWLKARNPA